MRWVRIQAPNGYTGYGWVQDDRVGPVRGSPFDEYERGDLQWSLEEVRLLAPVQPRKIIAVGRNYPAHAAEHGAEVPSIPLIFLKPPTAVIGPGEPIRLPPQSKQVEHEAELAVVIGRRGRWITVEDAPKYIWGYTAANDVTARDLQRRDNQWTRAKGFDTFAPIGPWVDTEFDPTDATVICRVNGEVRQMGSTREMVFSIPQIIAFVSSVMTLEPGDVILTGTPAGVGPIQPGDVVEVEIEGLGVLRNPVTAEQAQVA